MDLSKADPLVVRDIERQFPKLKITGYSLTSPQDGNYNCIAWAAGEDFRWWWPKAPYYWPKQAPRAETVSAFCIAYGISGYAECGSPDLESNFEKVALYQSADGMVKHAARQLINGIWTSKLGPQFDISHALEGLAGDIYGHPTVYLRRERKLSA